MNWETYLETFDTILNNDNLDAPYNDPEILDYTKLNDVRLKRWMKVQPLSAETIEFLKSIQQPLQWVVITEPWCGDAAHIVPIVYQMSQQNELFSFRIQLRDADSEIEKYLTNGTAKSIPIVIIRDIFGKDIFHWGPRPEAASSVFNDLKANNAPFDEIKAAIQNFYNKDKASSIQTELVAALCVNLSLN